MLPVVVTGGPGAGKTTLLAELGAMGYATVEESARAIIAERLAVGSTHPLADGGHAVCFSISLKRALSSPGAERGGNRTRSVFALRRNDIGRAGQSLPLEAAMTASNETNPEDRHSKTWQRRGLFAAAWAAVIGLVMKHTTEPVEAAASFQYADTTTTVTNTAAGPTVIIASDTSYTTTPDSVLTGQTIIASAMAGVHGVSGLRGHAPIVCGVYGETGRAAPTAGVIGDASHSSGGTGVVGMALEAIGVMGQATTGTGVQGTSISGPGVHGTSTSGAAVYGNTPASSSANTIAIYGVNASSYAGSVPGTGGWGVVGVSRYGHGVLGATSALGAGAVVGNSYGITGAWAGIFFGPAIVEGDFTVLGAKSAAVPHPDGTYRRLYCVESPESWFEDFGEAALACGEATIALDPDFTAVADTAKYHVFLTGYEGQADLSVYERTSAGFRVRSTSASGSGTFSWRIVAKRRHIATQRFEPVTVPPTPEMPAIPEPTAPTPIATPRRRQ